MTQPAPAIAFAATYALYFAALGVSAPYLNVYLQDLGMSAASIGGVAAMMIVVRIVGQLGWSWLADSSGQPLLIIRSAALATSALIAISLVVSSTTAFIGLLALWSLTVSACLPQIESLTLSHLSGKPAGYGRIRLWGSIGFLISVVFAGRLLDTFGSHIVMPMLVMIYLVLTMVLFAVPRPARSDSSATVASNHEPIISTLQRVWVLLLVCFLMQASHAPFYTFFSIHLKALDYSGTAIGFLWAIGVVCEIGVFFVSANLLRRFSPQWVLVFTFITAAVRWVMLAVAAHSPFWVSVSQCLHGVTFGACHAASIHIIHSRFPVSSRHRGQALYASLTFGCGTALGAWLAGLSWQSVGATATFIVAGGVAGLAAIVATASWARTDS